MRRRHHRRWPKLTRDGAIFVVGLGGIIYETLIHSGEPREPLLIVFAAMIGLPAFLRADEKKSRKDRDDADTEE